jgi:hypothetical protein
MKIFKKIILVDENDFYAAKMKQKSVVKKPILDLIFAPIFAQFDPFKDHAEGPGRNIE